MNPMTAPVLDLKNPPPAPAPADAAASEDESHEERSALFLDDIPEAVEWEAAHALPTQAKQRYYILLAGIVLVGGSVAFWQGSWSVALVTLIGAAAWEVHDRFAKPVKVQVDGHGLTVGGVHYPHARLTSFDIHEMPDGVVELSVATDAWHTRHLRFPLGQQDPEQLRELLLRHVPEGRHDIPRLEWWLRTPRG